jgi:LuxR family maltose regulon positive regulatory protein
MGKDNDIVLARIAFQRGDVKRAFELVQFASESARRNNMLMVVYKMAIVQVELRLLAGDLDQAEIGLKELDSVAQARLPKGEHVVAHLHAIYWASSGQTEKAFEILEPLEQEVREEGSLRRTLGVLITKALLCQKLSYHEEAKRLFETALRLAAPRGYEVAFFPHPNRQTHPLLQATRSAAPAFVDSILEATRPEAEPSTKLPDPLSEQERRVLRLIVEGKSNQDIAAELVISPGTAKWHVHNILQKLGVNNRAQAIVCARELGIE